MSFDYVCADLPCLSCAKTPSDPCAIDLQTKIARHPELRAIRVGDRVELLDDPRVAGYLTIGSTVNPQVLRVIEAWSCPSCGANQWARLTFRDEVLSNVANTDLTTESLEAADFITWEVMTFVPLEHVEEFQSLSPAQLRSELARLAIEQK
jgi:hypothetical protein